MPATPLHEVAPEAPAIRVRYRGTGHGWWVVGPGVIAGVRQDVLLAGPFTSAESAVERAEELRAESVAHTHLHSVKVSR